MNLIDLTERNLPENCYLFKHSTACPVSHGAAEEVKKGSFNLPLYWVNVIQQRDLSNWVAEKYQVKHESPQLILIKENKPVQVWNHREIYLENFTV